MSTEITVKNMSTLSVIKKHSAFYGKIFLDKAWRKGSDDSL